MNTSLLCSRCWQAGFATLLIACLFSTARCHGQEFAGAEFRHWTTADGVRSSVPLKVVALSGNVVKLQREDGQFVELPLVKLSRADREYLRDQRRGSSTPAPATDSSAPASSAATTDWPRWRGPNNDGVSQETGLLDQWPADGPPLAWSVEGLGSGYSSVAVSQGKIYTLGNKGGGTKLICLSADNGAPLWEANAGGGSDPNCTPTVDPEAKLVFGITHRGDLLCANSETGATVWKSSFQRDFGGRMMSGWGYSESPLVHGDRLICTPGSDRAVLAALNKRTGRALWTTPLPGGKAGYASPVISNAGGIQQYVTLVGKGLIGVAADDGRLLWHYPRIANSTANVPTPIVQGDYVFGSSGYGDGGSALLRLSRQGNGIRFEEVYYKDNNELQNHHGGMVLIGNHVYMGEGHNNGFPVCVELASGRAVWGPQRGAGSGSAAITAADGKLYFRYENAVMALIDATPDGYQLRSQFRIKSNNGKSWAHPVIADKKLYLRDQHQLHCYDISG